MLQEQHVLVCAQASHRLHIQEQRAEALPEILNNELQLRASLLK